MIFLQDNASYHTAKIVKDEINRLQLKIFEHARYSPDLNFVIEYSWNDGKTALAKTKFHSKEEL